MNHGLQKCSLDLPKNYIITFGVTNHAGYLQIYTFTSINPSPQNVLGSIVALLLLLIASNLTTTFSFHSFLLNFNSNCPPSDSTVVFKVMNVSGTAASNEHLTKMMDYMNKRHRAEENKAQLRTVQAGDLLNEEDKADLDFFENRKTKHILYFYYIKFPPIKFKILSMNRTRCGVRSSSATILPLCHSQPPW